MAHAEVQDKEMTMAIMEEQAEIARKELATLVPALDHDTLVVVAQWWGRHFMTAGHKRLFRALKEVLK